MPDAGDIITLPLPGTRLATTRAEADSATFTAETLIDSVTASLISGRRYRVRWVVSMQSSVNNDTMNARIREDDLVGNQLVVRRELSSINTAGSGPDCSLETEFTAAATGDKTFVGTGARSAGTGNITAEGNAQFPRLLYVDYLSG